MNFKMVIFPSPSAGRPKRFFSDVHYENLVEFMEEKIIKVNLPEDCVLQTCSQWASNYWSSTFQGFLPEHWFQSKWDSALVNWIISIYLFVYLNLFVLGLHFSSRYKKNSWLFFFFLSFFFFLFCFLFFSTACYLSLAWSYDASALYMLK